MLLTGMQQDRAYCSLRAQACTSKQPLICCLPHRCHPCAAPWPPSHTRTHERKRTHTPSKLPQQLHLTSTQSSCASMRPTSTAAPRPPTGPSSNKAHQGAGIHAGPCSAPAMAPAAL